METKCSFKFSASFTLSDKLAISCFEEHFLLFSQTSEIVILQKTVSCFQYLSEVLENADLFSTCEKVRSTCESQTFFLTSQIFQRIPDDIFNSLYDFKIFFHDYIIKCNKHFASLISKRIHYQIKDSSNNSFMNLSDFSYPELIKIFFCIIRRNMILVDESNINRISATLYFLKFDSLSIQILQNVWQLTLLTIIFLCYVLFLLIQFNQLFLNNFVI
jgi:hypothetical protein